MLSNYLKIALRSILKFKGYAAINLVGLALGLASGVLIFIYVFDELSFDRFHAKGNRIYRVITLFHPEDKGGAETNGWPIGNILKKDFPEVESVIYMRNSSYLQVRQEGKLFVEKSFFASEDFFKMFSFNLKEGNPETALRQPYSVVLTEDLERKYFPGTSALGKMMAMGDTLQFMVTGVMENVPAQSHMQFGMLVSFATYGALVDDFSIDGGWGNINMRNYVLLHEHVDVEAFRKKAKNIYMDRVGDQMKKWGWECYVALEPVKDIYLRTQSGNGMGPLGSISRVYLVSGTAAFVILLACINFINLATARSVYRSKEVGLRKVVGSSRSALVRQFVSESFVFTILSFVLALALVGLFLPSFNTLVNKAYEISALFHPAIIFGCLVLIVIVAFLAGYYPAWVISAVRPAEVLKGKMHSSVKGVQLRRSLVVFQFVISVGLVLGTLVVIDQLEFMRNENLGFSKNQIIVVNTSRTTTKDKTVFGVFKNDLEALASVKKVTLTNSVPGRPGWQGQISYSENTPKDQSVSVEYMAVDEDYIETLGLKVIAGRNFDEKRELDMKEGLLINEKAASMYGWTKPDDAIDKKITSPSGYPAGTVIGVVKDYHQLGLQQGIGPIVMDHNPGSGYYYAVKFLTKNTEQIIGSLDDLWKKHFPENDFSYFFLDEDFERQYQSEKRLAEVFAIFSGLAILIAIIGLFGLVSFMITSRTKEIGIRKVLGADVLTITKLFSREFLILIIVSNAIACPLAFYFANQWLQGFAYRTSVSIGLFVMTFFVAMGLTLLTVSFQTIKAAMADPVRSLRYE